MNHRIVSGVIAALLALFGAAALLFAVGSLPLRSPTAPASARPGVIPHERGGAYAACRDCHRAEGGATVLPATHRHFAVGTCATCHPAAVGGS